MQTLFSLPAWLDALLIAPFRWPNVAEWGLWLGCAVLAFYCIGIGKIIYIGLQKLHNTYYTSMQDDMQHYHGISMKALHLGNKEAYFAANKIAHEKFGKHFFARASISMASLVPVPFALAWLSLRFEGITLYTLPHTEINMGYVFVFLTCYITLRITWAKFFH